jgi:hypothetical protein
MTHDHDHDPDFAEARRLMEAARPLLTTAQGGSIDDPDVEFTDEQASRIQSDYSTWMAFSRTIHRARQWGLADDDIRSLFEEALPFTTRRAASY